MYKRKLWIEINLCILNNNNNTNSLQSNQFLMIKQNPAFFIYLFRIAKYGSKIWIYNIAVPYAGNQQIR